MKNISYFCSVKRFISIYKLAATLAFLLCSSSLRATQAPTPPAWVDSVDISLLTCSPHDEVYSLYGHTAIRIEKKGCDDTAVNYGIFSFRKPFFILRFVFGLTDYEMGIQPFPYFYDEYMRYGSAVVQQTLNLTRAEKYALLLALEDNYKPENRVYRYNYFYNNCTTKARDIIESCVRGRGVEYPQTAADREHVSFRQIIHSCNEDHRWARFGNDILLGVGADANTTKGERQFLPANLMKDFDRAVIVGYDGSRRPLISKTDTILLAIPMQGTESHVPSPTASAWMLTAIILAACLYEHLSKKKAATLDVILMLATSIAGIILFAMLFSQHPTVSTNLQLLLLNPIPLFFIYNVVRRRKSPRVRPYWYVAIGLIIMYYIGGIFQDYAEGMNILALSLLIRAAWNIYFTKTTLRLRHDAGRSPRE